MDDLAKSLGYTIKPEAEWPALWSSLNGNFSDKATFVPSITRLTVTWYQQLATRVERDDQSQWTEKLLENLSQAGTGFSNTLWVQVSGVHPALVESDLTFPPAFSFLRSSCPESMGQGLQEVLYGNSQDHESANVGY